MKQKVAYLQTGAAAVCIEKLLASSFYFSTICIRPASDDMGSHIRLCLKVRSPNLCSNVQCTRRADNTPSFVRICMRRTTCGDVKLLLHIWGSVHWCPSPGHLAVEGAGPPTSSAGRQSSDGRGRIRPLTHRGKATRRRAAPTEVPPTDHSDRRPDPGAGDPVQASTEVQEEREPVQPPAEAERGVR